MRKYTTYMRIYANFCICSICSMIFAYAVLKMPYIYEEKYVAKYAIACAITYLHITNIPICYMCKCCIGLLWCSSEWNLVALYAVLICSHWMSCRSGQGTDLQGSSFGRCESRAGDVDTRSTKDEDRLKEWGMQRSETADRQGTQDCSHEQSPTVWRGSGHCACHGRLF